MIDAFLEMMSAERGAAAHRYKGPGTGRGRNGSSGTQYLIRRPQGVPMPRQS